MNAIVNHKAILGGLLQYTEASEHSLALVQHARDLANRSFGGVVPVPTSANIREWVSVVQGLKAEFTNGDTTRGLMEELIRVRYQHISGNCQLWYDVPRLRIIPPSEVFRVGVSYNYQPHRDTWYGAPQEQVNHWMAVSGVGFDSTFFIAPSLFHTPVENSSVEFDLGQWNREFRNRAVDQVAGENRPHPHPRGEVPDDLIIRQIMPTGADVAFSGHHIHGSCENVSSHVRVSIDFRVSSPSWRDLAPENVDCSATGDYYSEMRLHPGWQKELL